MRRRWRSSSAGFAPPTSKDSPDRPTIGQLLSAWGEEVLIAPRVFLWRQPFRSAAIADSVPADARGRRGVVLVHGFFCNRGLWNPWMHRLEREGIPYVALTLEPAFGSIDRYRRRDRSRGCPAREQRPEWPRSWSDTAWAGWRSGPGGRAKATPRALSSHRHHRHAASRHLDRAPCPHAQRHGDAHRQSLARSPGAGRRRRGPRPIHLLLGPLRQHRLPDPRCDPAGGRQPPPSGDAARRDGLPPGRLRLCASSSAAR